MDNNKFHDIVLSYATYRFEEFFSSIDNKENLHEHDAALRFLYYYDMMIEVLSEKYKND